MMMLPILALTALIGSASSFQPQPQHHHDGFRRNPCNQGDGYAPTPSAAAAVAANDQKRTMMQALRPIDASRRRPASTALHMAKKKDSTAAERERRDEDRRRQDRKEDVVIGKTSAMAGAKDFEINPKATEEEWLQYASEVERLVHSATDTGMEMLQMFRVKEAAEAFGRVFEVKPNAYLWQAGIAKFYLKEYLEAAEIFARNAKLFESKFGSAATEERIWRDATQLKYAKSLNRKDTNAVKEIGGAKYVVAQINDDDGDDGDTPPAETRRVMKLARDLFAASAEGDTSRTLLSHAKLESIAGKEDPRLTPDRKMWKLTAWYYLGLHADCLGDEATSCKCMKMAILYCPNSGKSENVLYTLPMLHMAQRDWFDDDDFDDFGDMDDFDDEAFDDGGIDEPIINVHDGPLEFTSTPAVFKDSDPIIEASIREGISKLTFGKVKEALKLKKMVTVGSKEELQQRLFLSLMKDAGFHQDMLS